jgi:class 3 adenylate cyclase/CHASE2 domain-containing sensor protein
MRWQVGSLPPKALARLLLMAVFTALLGQALATLFLGPLDDYVLSKAFAQRSDSTAWSAGLKRINAFKDQLVMLAVDEETLQKNGFGSWPLPRRLYGQLVEKLARGKARAVAFDILFDTSQDSLDPRNDASFAAALRTHQLAYLVNHTNTSRGQERFIDPTQRLIGSWSIQERTQRIGWTHTGDDYLKAVPLFKQLDTPHYALSVLLAASLWKVPIEQIHGEPDGSVLHVGSHDIPLQDGSYRINYLWGGSLSDVALSQSTQLAEQTHAVEARGLEGQQRINCLPFYAPFEMSDSDLEYYFKDRVVIIGVTAAAGFDLKKTPMGQMAGMDVHTNLILDLVGEQHLKLPSPGASRLAASTLAVLLTLLIVAAPRLGIIALLGTCGLLYGFAPLWFLKRSWVFEPFSYIASSLLSSGVVGSYTYYAEKQAKQRLSDLIKKVAPLTDALVADFLQSQQESLALKGESTELTVMFSDIRGYTTLSEQVDSQTLFDTLNVLYSATGNVIEAHNGAVFEYLGDAQMVLFGYDPKHRNHADDALRAALGMMEAIEQLNRDWKAQGKPELSIGIGLCTGTVALGVMGSQQRQQRSVIGDTVNTSARLQGMSSQLGSPIVVGESTYKQLQGHYSLSKREGIALKGKSEPVTVYLHQPVEG